MHLILFTFASRHFLIVGVIQYKNIVVTYYSFKDVIWMWMLSYDTLQECRCGASFVMKVGIQCFEGYRKLSLRA